MIAMVMDEKTIPLDLIIHPGEILAEVLEERGITCAELADRTGFPIIYISNVIVGKDDISEDFAKSLEQILEVSRSFGVICRRIILQKSIGIGIEFA